MRTTQAIADDIRETIDRARADDIVGMSFDCLQQTARRNCSESQFRDALASLPGQYQLFVYGD